MKHITAVATALLIAGLSLCGCGNNNPMAPAADETPARLTKPIANQKATVLVTVTKSGKPANKGLQVGLSRSISGRARNEMMEWIAYTNDEGKAGIIIAENDPQFWRVGATGYYIIRVIEPGTNNVLVQRGSVPINNGHNEVSIEISQLPDLKVEATISATEVVHGLGPVAWVDYTIKNTGKAATTQDAIVALVSNGEVITFCGQCEYNAVKALAPGETGTGRFTVGLGDKWLPGEYDIRVMVDYLDQTYESDEANNLSNHVMLTVKEGNSENLPDLVVEVTGIDATNFVVSNDYEKWVWVHYKVTNRGADVPGDVFLRDHVLLNGKPIHVYDSGYMVIEGPLPAGASKESMFAITHADWWPPGDYKLWLEVDHWKQINESDEDNNLSAPITFKVLPPAK